MRREEFVASAKLDETTDVDDSNVVVVVDGITADDVTVVAMCVCVIAAVDMAVTVFVAVIVSIPVKDTEGASSLGSDD